MVPGTFEVCWQCLSDKAGQQPANAQQLLSEVDGDGHETEAPVEVEESPAPPEILKPEADVEPPKPEAVVEEDEEELAGKCPRCGSTRLIPDVTVEASEGKLRVAVSGDPEALIFKDWLYGEANAFICGKCGHIELRVVNPGELYEHYQKSRGLDRPFDARKFSPINCRACGMLMSGKLAACPHCGASQMD
jgi:Zn finger protein HypA/HybF involved in hydrogenase expression